MKVKPKIFDPGTGESASAKQQRIMNKDGSFNIIHINRKRQFRDIYTYLINTSWSHFFIVIFSAYIIINLFFGLIYYLFGVENLGLEKTTVINDFLHCFYFSTQTFTTIGYGAIAPQSNIDSTIAAIEGFLGLLFFAFASGLFYGRFSRPSPNLKFSKHFLIRDHNGTRALMFRMMHKHPNVVVNVECEVSIAIKKDEDGKTNYTYYLLKLERDRLVFMPYTWTLVHPINSESPLYNYSDEELRYLDAEILVSIHYFDDTFSQTIHQRHSYLFDEMKMNEKFVPSFLYDEQGNGVLHHELMNETELI